MKKVFSILLCSALLFGITGCGNSKGDNKGLLNSNKTKEFSGYIVSGNGTNSLIRSERVIVSKDGYYGVMDLEGNMIVECDAYTKIEDYSQGLALVEKDGKWGFIDTKGKVIVPIEYDDPTKYSQHGFSTTDKVAWIVKDNKLGIVNTKGEVVKEPSYNGTFVENFLNGYAHVLYRGETDEYYCFDVNGNEVSYLTYCRDNKSNAKPYNVYPDKSKENGLYGYKSEETDEVVIDYKYDYVTEMPEGIGKGILPDGTVEIINEKGKVLLKFKNGDI